MKKLIINDRLYAEYQIHKHHSIDSLSTFIKIIILLVPNDLLKSHQEIFHLIEFLEQKTFFHISYQNP